MIGEDLLTANDRSKPLLPLAAMLTWTWVSDSITCCGAGCLAMPTSRPSVISLGISLSDDQPGRLRDTHDLPDPLAQVAGPHHRVGVGQYPREFGLAQLGGGDQVGALHFSEADQMQPCRCRFVDHRQETPAQVGDLVTVGRNEYCGGDGLVAAGGHVMCSIPIGLVLVVVAAAAQVSLYLR